MSDDRSVEPTRRRTVLKGLGAGATVAGLGAVVSGGSLVTAASSEQAPPVAWTRRYRPRVDEDDEQKRYAHPDAVVNADDGGYVLGGYHWRYEDGEVDDFLLVKTDAKGRLEWSSEYGGQGKDRAFDLVQTADGGYLLAGLERTNRENPETSETEYYPTAWAVKTDSQGTVQWDHRPRPAMRGRVEAVTQTTDGDVVLAGFVQDHDYTMSAWFARVDETGATIVDETFAGDDPVFYGVTESADGGLVFSGQRADRGWVLKTDLAGTTQWETTLDANRGRAAGLLRTDADDFLVTGGGTHGSDAEDLYLTRLDQTGTEQWTRRYGTDDRGESGLALTATADGGYVVVGQSRAKEALTSDSNIFAVKTDGAGALEWRSRYLKTETTLAHDVVQAPDGGYAIPAHEYFVKVGGDDVEEAATPTPEPTPDGTATPEETPTESEPTSTATETPAGSGDDCSLGNETDA